MRDNSTNPSDSACSDLEVIYPSYWGLIKKHGGLSMKIYICQVCRHLAFNNLPDRCPVCYARKDKYIQNDAIFKESIERSPETAIKHMPAVGVYKSGSLIIGKVIHPMEERHYIRFVDAYQDDHFIARTELIPLSVYPASCFYLKGAGDQITIVENCNIHGYRQSRI
jgi:desulfoferrodoxin (superoxide reductase-like protein)